ncbi:MAG: hypothetical protein ABSF18_06150, partial [Gammaproteobacteria bacterium]
TGNPVVAADPTPIDIRNEIVKDTQQGLYGSTQSKLLENPPEDQIDCDNLENKDQEKIYKCNLIKQKPPAGSY